MYDIRDWGSQSLTIHLVHKVVFLLLNGYLCRYLIHIFFIQIINTQYTNLHLRYFLMKITNKTIKHIQVAISKTTPIPSTMSFLLSVKGSKYNFRRLCIYMYVLSCRSIVYIVI